ncbi:MAG: aspartate kinase [Kofleriaceae bacterium]|nr:aspartate kinase [Kofleriaceae bacterium]MBP9169370.1 aspartate kinase [Kofleriaceae bacterium]MBP9862307.1 aspartate kinase [Kofleriaceae bacterium]
MVQKYGGSSVADVDKIRLVAARIARTKAAGKKVVVVVSAMGKTTNALIDKAKQVSPSPSRRELDMLLTCGEREAMALLAMAVTEQGLESISFTGSQAGIMTNDRHSGARILEVRPFRIEDELDRGKVVIVAGFQGVSYKREVTTLGRGGSDTTAVALAAALRADYCEICSDVDGVYTADPRVVGAAELLHAISHDEMLELAAQGAKVLHDASVEFARRSGIALYARATNKDGGGTRIDWSPERERQVAAVTGQAALVRLRASGGAAVENALQILEAASIPLTHLDLEGKELRAWFTTADVPDWSAVKSKLENVLGAAMELGEEGAVTMVGHGIGGNPGIIVRARATAIAAGVPLNAVSVSPLRITLWCDRPHVDDLTRALHKAFVES